MSTTTELLPFDLPLAREAFGTVAQLHADATRRAADRLTADDLAELERLTDASLAALREGRIADAIDHDTAFHRRFFEVADDPDLTIAAELLVPRLRRMDLWLFTRAAFDPTESSHPAILAALRAGDAEAAAELVEASFLDAGEQLAAIVEREPVPRR
ncbi:MAG TPA: FCD domain-containing protein [Baekduia sp.]|uniref:FCD domain-containing protein n=1 Tax=Baekduia sp. TaxID=2600305 RepID=UPI002D773997|nr:FCD domain-containing protein [Baekduia sp.]HET6509434.1 FCD domain-containing protein [Baekduia sp.]